MSRITHILQPEEEILFQTKVHKWVLVGPAVFTFYTLVLWIFFLGQLFLFMFIFALLWLAAGLIRYTYTDYILTNRRFMRVSGYWFLHTVEYPLEKIDSVTYWKLLSDKWLDTGVVTLFGIGIKTATFRSLARARELRDAIHSQLSVEPVHYFD